MPHTTINNINLHYTKTGIGKPLIIIHGILYDSSGYKKLADILSKTHTVYSIDLPMHGKSSKPKEYLSIKDLADITHKFTIALKIESPSILAHSAGTLVALNYVKNHKTKKLILIEPAGTPYYKNRLTLLFNLAIKKTFYSLIKYHLKTFTIIKMGLYNSLKNIFNKNYHKLIKEEFNKDYTEILKSIKTDTIIIWAKQDKIFPHTLSNKYNKLIKNSKLITINGTHDWIILEPEKESLILSTL